MPFLKDDTMLIERILPTARERLATVSDNALLKDAAKLLCQTHTSLVVVCNTEGTMVGVISKSDIVRQVSAGHDAACAGTVAASMIHNVVSCRPEDTLHDVLSVMKDRGFVHLPVVDAGSRPLGVVNARDALGVLLKGVEHEESLLRDYVMGIGYR